MPVNANLSQRIRQALYSLKREYGGAISIYRLNSSTTNAMTGERVDDIDVFPILRAPILPSKVLRMVPQGVIGGTAGNQFPSGGFYDTGTRDFIIDRRDVRTLTHITEDDWIVYNGKKYQITTIEEFEPDAGWIVSGKELVGEVPQQIFLMRADNLLSFTDQSAVD